MNQKQIPAMQMPQMQEYASQLEACVALDKASTPEGAAAVAASSGIISSILTLVAALRAGDWPAVARGVRDLLNVLLGDGDGTINFQQQAIAAGIDWKALIAVLLKLLPAILGA